MKFRDLIRVAALLSSVAAGAGTARAATFRITITNTSAEYMSPGVFTLTPLLDVGAAPNPGSKQFFTYEYSNFDCNVPDAYCTKSSPVTCWFANETTLINRWGLQLGVNAWVPSPPSLYFGYKVFAPGDSATVVITAQPGQKLSYVSKAGNAQTYHDQNVMLHAPNDAGTLAVPLFDGNNLPLPVVSFDLGGYTVASPDRFDGTKTPECTNQCNNPTTGCFVAVGSVATGALLPPQPTAPQFSLAWQYTAPAGYLTDGIALGDLNNSAGNEALVLMEGSGVAGNVAGVGRAVALCNANGTVTSSFDGLQMGNDFMGFPMIENLAGSTYSQFLVSEFGASFPAPGSAVYARNGGSAYWTSTGYGYPGNWNMGPSAGDVRSDTPGNEVVIADYNGDIVVLKKDTATTLNTYNLFASNGENVYGHAAIADVSAANPGNEIVVFGATTGKVYVFGAPNSLVNPKPLNLLYTSLAPVNGQLATGSGPAIADLDGDNKNEIVVATSGTGGVYAYNVASTACKYKWSTPGGADYSWSSPVIGDVDGDGKPEVIVLSSDSVLSVLKVPAAGAGCQEGSVLWQYTVGSGGAAWFTPALANLVGSANLDIVAANYKTLEVIDVAQRAPVLRFNDNNAQFYPSAVIEAGAVNAPGAAIYVSGWVNGSAYKLTTPTGYNVPAKSWSSFMGGNLRTGVPQ